MCLIPACGRSPLGIRNFKNPPGQSNDDHGVAAVYSDGSDVSYSELASLGAKAISADFLINGFLSQST